MRISGLQIDDFGIWSQVQFDSLADGVTVFYGPNEAGKTTLLQFIRMALYGFDAGRAGRYLQANGQGMLSAGRRIGGSLVLSQRDDDYHIRRYASQRDPLEDPVGELRVTTRDGNRQGGHRLMNLLSGIDETVFNNVFAVGLRELQYLGTLNDTQAARYLYNLSTGTDRVSLVDVMRQLQATRGHLIGSRDAESLLATLVAERAGIETQLQGLSASLDRWAQQRAELEQLDEEISRIEAERTALDRRSRHLELAARVEPIWHDSREIEQRIQSLGMIPAISEDTQRELRELAQQITSHEAQLQEVQRQRAAADNGSAFAAEDAFLHHAVRIESILEDRPTIAALDDQLGTLRHRLEETQFELQAELERLGLAGHESGSAPQLDQQVLAALRQPADRVEMYREQLEQAKKESARLKDEAGRVANEMAEALGRDKEWLERLKGAALESGGDTHKLVDDLRRRLQVERQLTATRESHEQLNARRKSLLASQLLPWEVLQALGAMFALGSVCLALALFGGAWGFADRSRFGLSIMGFVAVLASGVLKLLLNGSTQAELQDCVADIEDARKRLAEIEREATSLDQRIPGTRPGAATVAALQQRLLKVEALIPQDGRRRALLEASSAYEQRAVQLAHRLKGARDQWGELLQHFGLPSNLAPSQIDHLAKDAGHLSQLNQIATQLQAQVVETQRELANHTQRMTTLFADLRLVPKGERVLDHLHQLQAARKEHEEHLRQMEKRRGTARQLRDREQSLQRDLRQLISRRAARVAAQGAIDDDNLHQLVQRRQQWEQLVQQRDARRDELARLLPDKATQKTVFAELLAEGSGSAAERLDALRSECQRGDARLKELCLRRGAVTERIRQLADDRGLADKMLELAQVDAKLEKAVEQTQTISAMTHLLRQVYKRYEKDRQPETLKEASLHLRRMTRDKYTRIWTPLDEDVLFVDDPRRLSIPVDQLSRGTREQLFLALRLALVSGYARRGCQLPLVLDDVLVNFDEGRTRAAAEVLMDFGHSGHQVLIFTCHEHVMQMFGDLGADVRRLPLNSHERAAGVEARLERVASPKAQSGAKAGIGKVRRDRRVSPGVATYATQFEIGYGEVDAEDHLVGFDGPPLGTSFDEPFRESYADRQREPIGDSRDIDFPGDWDTYAAKMRAGDGVDLDERPSRRPNDRDAKQRTAVARVADGASSAAEHRLWLDPSQPSLPAGPAANKHPVDSSALPSRSDSPGRLWPDDDPPVGMGDWSDDHDADAEVPASRLPPRASHADFDVGSALELDAGRSAVSSIEASATSGPQTDEDSPPPAIEYASAGELDSDESRAGFDEEYSDDETESSSALDEDDAGGEDAYEEYEEEVDDDVDEQYEHGANASASPDQEQPSAVSSTLSGDLPAGDDAEYEYEYEYEYVDEENADAEGVISEDGEAEYGEEGQHLEAQYGEEEDGEEER